MEQQPQQAPEEAEVEGSEEGTSSRFGKFSLVCFAGADDDDEARSEATFRFRVENNLLSHLPTMRVSWALCISNKISSFRPHLKILERLVVEEAW